MENKLNGGDKAGSSMRRLIDSFGEGGDLAKAVAGGWEECMAPRNIKEM